jgi:hypothetical protein
MPSEFLLCLARMPAAEAAVSVLVPELVDTGTVDRADHGGGIVVVEHVTVLLAASFDIRNGEGRDVHGFQSWMFDGCRCHLRDCSCAFLPGQSLVLGRQAAEVAFV